MDITKTLSRIVEFRTKAIFADNKEVEDQLQKLIPLVLAVYEHREHIHLEEYIENRKAFYIELQKLPEEWRPFKVATDI